MTDDKSEEAFSPEWVEKNIMEPAHELIVLRKIIPWEKITGCLPVFYVRGKGAKAKSIRTMLALLIISRFRGLSDREVVRQVREPSYTVFLQCSG